MNWKRIESEFPSKFKGFISFVFLFLFLVIFFNNLVAYCAFVCMPTLIFIVSNDNDNKERNNISLNGTNLDSIDSNWWKQNKNIFDHIDKKCAVET